MRIENNEGYFRTMAGIGEPILKLGGIFLGLLTLDWLNKEITGFFPIMCVIIAWYFIIKYAIKHDKEHTKKHGL